MANDINYGQKMHRAMRSLIAEVLTEVSIEGLPGEHHFFITYDTQHPDVGMADWLFDRYPDEITIVVQHWFDNLVVGDDGFQITLNFGDSPEPLVVPFDAIRTFVDPSVEFGLRFEAADEDGDELHEVVELPDIDEPAEAEKPEETPKKERVDGDAQVVSLDSFRKS
ncbi:MAG: ClpXP protease specificity-enhancing factor SspB [Litoreibacter sp.]